MQHSETPVIFDCEGKRLLGMIHHVDELAKVGVLIVVGGPQYRVGSHRQFVLLARHLARNGIPVMRFDVRGMGDSEGSERRFDELDADIRSAIDCFQSSNKVENVVIWGLCDAASAALFYAYQDQRVAGLVLLNPWVFTEQGSAKTYLKHYYLQRFLSGDFWRKVLSLKFDVLASLISLARLLNTVAKSSQDNARQQTQTIVSRGLPLPIRMRDCWIRFAKPVLLILSGRDLTADEFRMMVSSDSGWKTLLDDMSVTTKSFPEADHTFSSAIFRDQVAEWTLLWIFNQKFGKYYSERYPAREASASLT